MCRFSCIIFILLLFISGCDKNDISVIGVNYDFGKSDFSFTLLLKNETTSLLVFPVSMRKQLQSIKENNGVLEIDDCNKEFKSVEEMFSFRDSKISLDDELHTDFFSTLHLIPILPGHRFLYTGHIAYKDIAQQNLQKLSCISIKLHYGIAKSWKLRTYEDFIVTDGSMKNKMIQIPLSGLQRIDIKEIPSLLSEHIWDFEE